MLKMAQRAPLSPTLFLFLSIYFFITSVFIHRQFIINIFFALNNDSIETYMRYLLLNLNNNSNQNVLLEKKCQLPDSIAIFAGIHICHQLPSGLRYLALFDAITGNQGRLLVAKHVPWQRHWVVTNAADVEAFRGFWFDWKQEISYVHKITKAG